ncbi:MAG TPA: hypothetical protein QGF58_21935 [Myxococcota bacterium]|nr:hypothetical protein [Myxococcota bacterium]
MATALLALGGICSLISFVGAIIILISAFKESVGQGFLCLCVPFYILYFAFAKFQHEKKNMILGAWLGGTVLNLVFQGLAGAMA